MDSRVAMMRVPDEATSRLLGGGGEPVNRTDGFDAVGPNPKILKSRVSLGNPRALQTLNNNSS